MKPAIAGPANRGTWLVGRDSARLLEPGEWAVLIVTTDGVAGREIDKVFGMVRGSTVRAKHVGRDIMASFKHLIGGELSGYTEMLEESRQEAMQRMIVDAQRLGADAIVATRVTTSAVMQGAAEILTYGTAVKLKPAK